jgi:hypothetical protein
MAASYTQVEAVLPEECERARAQASLALDCELSEHERAQLRTHLSRCGDCAAFVGGLRNLTVELRGAPLPQPSRPLVPRRPHRLRGPLLLVTLAVVGAALAGGLAGSLRHAPQRTVVAVHAVQELPLHLPGAQFSPRVPV